MKVVVCDSGQIEARVLAWLAEHESLVNLFREGNERAARGDKAWDIYSVIGSELFGMTLAKSTHPLERQVSKNLSLGLGFNMGWYKLAMEMAKGMLGSKPVIFDISWVQRFNVDMGKFMSDERKLRRIEGMPSRLAYEDRVVHCAVAHYLVRWYRNNNQPIVDFWHKMDKVLEAMLIEDDTPVPFGANDCLVAMRHAIGLPNGLKLRYPGLKSHQEEDDEGETRTQYSYMGGPVAKERTKIYGGLATENVVQALARVIVYHQAVNLRKQFGYRFALTSHDELVYVVPDREAELCLERVTKEMCTPPPWAVGLPVTAEGAIGQRYGDAK